MKKIYIAVLATIIISIALFALSLLYLDRENHKTYFFNFSVEGFDEGTSRVDRFVTEDKIIYKSSSYMPFRPILTESKSRLALDRKHNLQSYLKERSGSGAFEIYYIENNNNKIGFVGTFLSDFAYLTDLPVKPGTFVFREDSPLTYLPILENYDFRIGRSQAFNVLTDAYPLLPPMKRLLILTSIRDDALKIGGRKVKTECLLIKIKNHPQGMLWVTKSGRNLVAIEFPDKKLKITRVFVPGQVASKKFTLKDKAYREEDIKFENKKITLAGTLTLPAREGPLPAVLLIGGTREVGREGEGFFTYIADSLGRQGYMVLRYDKRGIGSSGGDSRAVTDADEIEDASAALDYLLKRSETDPSRVAIIGHGKGAYFASKLAADRENIKALVLMSPLVSPSDSTNLNFYSLNDMASILKWGDQYHKLVMKSRMETIGIVNKTKNAWISLLRIRCFLRKLREEREEKPIDIIRKVEIPVLILHGKNDEYIPTSSSDTLDRALEESGNKNHKLIYFGYLGHFFGKRINDGIHTLYYKVDEDVLNNISSWLDRSLPKIDLTLSPTYDILPDKLGKGGE
ncbi:MAG: alpha/beta fold hydrolase [Candidatus Omnitrophota bacterium]